MKQKLKTIGKFALIMVLVAFASKSYSQKSRLSITLNSMTTNYNYGSLNSQFRDYKKKFNGFQAGFSYQAGITSNFSVVPELYFAMKGGTLKSKNPLSGDRTTLKVNSIEMPILARLHYKNLYFNAGPYVGYNVGGRLKVENSETTPSISSRISFGNSAGELKRWDAGIQIGTGYSFNFKRSDLLLDIRYGYGLVNTSQDIERYNRMLNISIQISRPFQKNKINKKIKA